MDKVVFTAMSSAARLLEAQDRLAHNLANLNTPGYQAVASAAEARPAPAAALNTRVAVTATTSYLQAGAGPVQQTGNNLHVALPADTYLAVRDDTGQEAYTRAGDLALDPSGMLVTARGHAVLGRDGMIYAPANGSLSIASDGTVAASETGNGVPAVGRLKLVSAPTSNLVRGDDGLIRTRDNAPLATHPDARVMPGGYEGSNVSPVTAMVEMISLARQFDLSLQVIKSAEANDRAASSTLSLNG